MKTVDLPRGSVAACLGAILERDDVPIPGEEPWTVWRSWLGQFGLGLVPIKDPQHFNWPGPWIALLRDGQAAIAFGSPPGLVDGGDFAEVTEGYLVAPADVALWAPNAAAPARTEGRVEAIAVAPRKEAPMVVVDAAVAHAGRGLQGDRYHEGEGTFSNRHALGHDLTLIEAEATEDPVAARRNVITCGIDLNALVGRYFTVGEVECVGRRLCEPCAHLEKLTEPGVLRALVHIGGLRADVVRGGTIRAGDAVRAL